MCYEESTVKIKLPYEFNQQATGNTQRKTILVSINLTRQMEVRVLFLCIFAETKSYLQGAK